MSQLLPSHIRATAVRVASLRRLALSVLFSIATNSYQTTCTISERTFNKRQHANARYRVELSLTHSSITTWWQLGHSLEGGIAWMFHSANCWKKRAGEGKTAKAARLLFGPPAAPVQGKDLGLDQPGECLVHAARLCSSPTGKAARTTASKGPSQRVQQSQVALTDNHTETRNASPERGHCQNRSVSFKLTPLGSNCSFQSKQLLLAHGSLAGKFKCLAII